MQQVCGTCHQSSASYRIASNRIGSQSHRASPSGLVVSLAVAPIDCLAVAETRNRNNADQPSITAPYSLQTDTLCALSKFNWQKLSCCHQHPQSCGPKAQPNADHGFRIRQRWTGTTIALPFICFFSRASFLLARLTFLLADDATGHGDRRRQSISLILRLSS